MGSWCSKSSANGVSNPSSYNPPNPSSAEEIERRRQVQAAAAEERQKDFKQGGGGEKIKAKSKQLEEAEKKNKDIGGDNALKWSV